ncbi:MAG: helix-turn-helix transcriptional regulator [Rhizorhabdus sp.]|uniref:helix-turn-helix transcriptional regulator n=1 Tax=Rhizorhabdus sp. TaxID=1968843 RepID=UPI001B4E8A70|nr:helix-turn-helix transcriptional regulator [Rhizorhabdus sp.]MBP8231981.1 helix-turn-helix transcriptional regulator [Rhizorhabdus sp.]
MSYVIYMFPDNRIREFRKKAGLSQAELGKRVGLHQTQIGNLENGTRELTFEWARRIAEVLGCLLVDLLSEKDNPYRLSDEERRLIKHYRTADEAKKALVSRVAEPLAPVQSDDIARKSAA